MIVPARRRTRIMEAAVQELREIEFLRPVTVHVADLTDAATFPEIAMALEHARKLKGKP